MKHTVLSADSLTKFVIIASASRATNGTGQNMMNTATASHEVQSLGRTVKAFEMVTGFYAEQGQPGAYEQSMAIGVDSPVTLKAIIRLFCVKYQQECVLVWNKDTDSVWLMSDKGLLCELGKNGMHRTEASVETARLRGRVLPDAFTVAADGSVWEVC